MKILLMNMHSAALLLIVCKQSDVDLKWNSDDEHASCYSSMKVVSDLMWVSDQNPPNGHAFYCFVINRK